MFKGIYFTYSFASPYLREAFSFVAATGLWFNVASQANYLAGQVGITIDHPLMIFSIGYIGLIAFYAMRTYQFDLKKCFKPLIKYEEHEDIEYTEMIENLILAFVETENSSKYRILLFGYVEMFQAKNQGFS